MHSQPPKSPLSGGLSDMATIAGFTGIIEVDGIYYRRRGRASVLLRRYR